MPASSYISSVHNENTFSGAPLRKTSVSGKFLLRMLKSTKEEGEGDGDIVAAVVAVVVTMVVVVVTAVFVALAFASSSAFVPASPSV